MSTGERPENDRPIPTTPHMMASEAPWVAEGEQPLPLAPARQATGLDALMARLEKLEGQRRTLSRALVATLLLAVLALGAAGVSFARAWQAVKEERPEAEDLSPAKTAAPGGDEAVKARKFVLLDEKGGQRAILGVDDDWPMDEEKKGGTRRDPGLYLRDAKGNPRMSLASGEDGAYVQLLDAEGKTALVLAVAKDRQTMVAFNDPKGTTRAILGVGKEDKPLLILRGHGAIMGINDLAGKTRALLGTDKDGEGLIVIQDKTGKPLAQMP